MATLPNLTFSLHEMGGLVCCLRLLVAEAGALLGAQGDLLSKVDGDVIGPVQVQVGPWYR